MAGFETIELTVRGVLLDIEGTTSSISFVHDVMFPFVRERLENFLATHATRADVTAACDQIARDAGHESLHAWTTSAGDSERKLVIAEVHRLMDGDVKATGLKALQGLIWADGFHEGQLRSHVYPEVISQIQLWRSSGLDVRIYSSGSIAAQKLFFGHVDGIGDCLDLFSGHYDTTIGSKKESASYQRIAEAWGMRPAEMVFVSDIADELKAAETAGLQVVASIRPGNAPLPADSKFRCVDSFAKLNLSLADQS